MNWTVVYKYLYDLKVYECFYLLIEVLIYRKGYSDRKLSRLIMSYIYRVCANIYMYTRLLNIVFKKKQGTSAGYH